MVELIGDSARGADFAFVRLVFDGERIVEADASGLERSLVGLTLLEAASVGGEELAADALANAIGPVFRAPRFEGRIAVAMSGGVDSAVALLKSLPNAIGVTLRLWLDPDGPDAERACCSPDAVLAARATCHCARRAARDARPARGVSARASSTRSSAVTSVARRRTRASTATAASASRGCSRSHTAQAPTSSRPATTHASSSTGDDLLLARGVDPVEGPVVHARARSIRRSSTASRSRSAAQIEGRDASRGGARRSRSRARGRARKPASSPATTTATSSSVAGSPLSGGSIVDEEGTGARPPFRLLALHARPAQRSRRRNRCAGLCAARAMRRRTPSWSAASKSLARTSLAATGQPLRARRRSRKRSFATARRPCPLTSTPTAAGFRLELDAARVRRRRRSSSGALRGRRRRRGRDHSRPIRSIRAGWTS